MKTAFWQGVLKYGLGLGLLAVVVWFNWEPKGGHGLAEVFRRPVQFGSIPLTRPAEGAESLPPTDLLPFLAAVGVCAVCVGLTFYRWYVLVRAQNLPFTLRSAVRLGLVGYYYNAFLPGSVGGDFLKAYSIAKEQQRRTVAVATVMVDRLVGLVALFWLAALVGGAFWLAGDPMFTRVVERSDKILPVGDRLIWLLGFSCCVVGGTLAGYAVLAFLPDHRAERFAGRLRGIPGVGGSLAEFWTAVWLYHKQPRALAEALGLSVLGHAGFVLVFYLAARAFADPGALPRLAEHYLIIPVGLTFQALVPTPGGVGAGEAGFGGLYASVGTPAVAGVLGSLGNRLITWIIGLVGYIVFLRMRAAEGQPTTTRAEVEPPATAGKSPVLPAGAQG